MHKQAPPIFSGPAKALIIFAAFVVAVAGMRAASAILVPLMLAMFVASICAPAFFALQRLRFPPVLAILVLLLALVLVALLTIPIIDVSVRGLQDKLPSYQVVLQKHIADLGNWLEQKGTGVDDEDFRALFDWRSAFAFARSSLGKVTGLVGQTFFVLVLTAFILLEAQYLPKKLRGIPEFSAPFWDQLDQVASDVRGYMSLKSLTSLLTGGLVLAPGSSHSESILRRCWASWPSS